MKKKKIQLTADTMPCSIDPGVMPSPPSLTAISAGRTSSPLPDMVRVGEEGFPPTSVTTHCTVEPT